MASPLERLSELLQKAAESSKQAKSLIADFQGNIAKAKLDVLRKLAAEVSRKADDLATAELQALEEATGIVRELEKEPSPSGAVRAEDIAQHFRAVIDTIQLDARKPRTSEVATTLKSLDVEVKGLLVVEKDEVRIVTPTPQRPVDPGQISTIRMSFGAIPVLLPHEEPPADSKQDK